MAKKNPKNKNKPFLSFISFFLLLFSLSLIFFQISKKPKEVKAVPGQLNINAVSGGVQSFNQVGIGTTNPGAKLHVINGDGINRATQIGIGRFQDVASIPLYELQTADNDINFGQDALFIYGSRWSNNVWFVRGSSGGDRAYARIWNAGSSASNLSLFDASALTGGNENVRLSSSGNSWFLGGNVGIGTAGPGEKLDVQGGNLRASGVIYSTQDGYAQTYLKSWGLHGNGEIYIEPAPGNNLYLTDSWSKTGTLNFQFGKYTFQGGNVGIGTAGPGEKLDVQGGNLRASGVIYSTQDGYAQTYLKSWGLHGNGEIYIEPAPGNNLYLTDSWSKTGTLDFQFGKYTFQGGNVGIGTTNPGAKLHVVAAGGFGSEPIRAQSNSTFFSGVDAGGTVRFAINNDPGPTLNFYGYDSNWFNFMTVNNAGSRAVSFNAGNVGIGTTNPQSKLSIGNSGNSSYAVYVNTGSSGGVYSYGSSTGVYASGSTGVYGDGNIGVYGYGSTGVYASGSSYGVFSYGSTYGVYASGSTGVYASGSTGVYSYGSSYDFYGNGSKSYFAGNVGIGTTNPVQKLDVAGHIRIATSIYGNTRTNYFLSLQNDRNLCLYDNGNAVWCTNTYVSDIHLKKNIVDMEPVLDTLNKLRVIRFNYIDSADDGTHQQHIGMIAQEVEKYYPDMVYTAPNNQKLINYGKFSALLLQGLKDQQKEINSLKHFLDDISLNSSDDVVIVENNLGYSIKNKNDSFITRISAFAQLVVAKIQAGLIETKKLIVDGVDILKKINELSAKVESQQKEIEALKEEIKKLKK